MKKRSCSIFVYILVLVVCGVMVSGTAEAQREAEVQRAPEEGLKQVGETPTTLPSANKAQRVPEGLKKTKAHPTLPSSYFESPESNAKWLLGTNQIIEWITDATPGTYEVLLMQNNQVAGIIDDGYSSYMSPTDGKTLRYVRPWTKTGLYLYGGVAEPGIYKIRVKNKATNKYFDSPQLTLYKPTVQKTPAKIKKVSPKIPPPETQKDIIPPPDQDKDKSFQLSDDYKLYKIPELEVKLHSGGFEEYGTHWTDTGPGLLTFRWLHEIDGFNAVSYSIRSINQNIGNPQPLDNIPEKNKFSTFNIDFNPIAGNNFSYPQNYFVKLNFSFVDIANSSVKTIISSNEVKISIVKETGGQTIGVPELRVHIDTITILDDADWDGAGDLAFAFWLTTTKGYNTYKLTPYHGGSITASTGAEITTDIILTVEAPPVSVAIHAFGRDDDSIDTIPIGIIPEFTIDFESGKMGSNPECSDCGGDTGQGHTIINTGKSGGNQLSIQDFRIWDIVGPLRFQVDGRYEVVLP